MIRLLLVVVLASGCTLFHGAARIGGRAFDRLTGRTTSEAASGEPLNVQLQIGMLSDYVATQIVQQTEAPLSAAKEPNEREQLLRLRLDWASAVWGAVSGPSPYANAIDMLVTIAVGRRQLEHSSVARLLGSSLPPLLDALTRAEHDATVLVQRFVGAEDYRIIRDAIETKGDTSLEGRALADIDVQKLLGVAAAGPAPGAQPTNLFRILGMDPFSGLDPTTREIAQSRQFGERVLFNLQRLPILLRMNGELLINDAFRDLGVDRALSSMEQASDSIALAARVASALPDRLAAERAQLMADVTARADQLGALAHDYRRAFNAVTRGANAANQTLETLGDVVDRVQSRDGQGRESRPFDITEYSETASRINEAAVSLTALLARVDQSLESPALARVSPQAAAVLESADARGRRLLYTAFALGCALIVVASLAVLTTTAIIRRMPRRRDA